eukprot:10501401-Lingulodinium_polyedra.AAC.1
MAAYLNIDQPDIQAHLTIANAEQWSALPRKRMLLSTLPAGPGPGALERAWPWDWTWRPHEEAKM